MIGNFETFSSRRNDIQDKVMEERCKASVPTRKIRFSQDFIFPYLEDPNINLGDVIHQIRSGSLQSSDFPEMFVWLYDGLFFTHSNRWLWIFREANVETVTVKVLYPRKTHRAGNKLMNFMFTDNFMKYVDPMYTPAFRGRYFIRVLPDLPFPEGPYKSQPRAEMDQKTTPPRSHSRRSWNPSLAHPPKKSKIPSVEDLTEEPNRASEKGLSPPTISKSEGFATSNSFDGNREFWT